jgi:hypothetical protein
MVRSFVKLPSWISSAIKIVPGKCACAVVILFLMAAMLSGCMSPVGLMAVGFSDREDRLQWREGELAGHSLMLLDRDKVEWYQFSGNDTVTATIGEKVSTYRWKVDKGILQIYDKKTLVEELSLASFNGNTAVVTKKSGEFAKYKYQ